MSDNPGARDEGFYWVVLGQNPPEIAYWERGEWWLAGDARPWQPVLSPCGAVLSHSPHGPYVRTICQLSSRRTPCASFRRERAAAEP
jgi:hypothetical protein